MLRTSHGSCHCGVRSFERRHVSVKVTCLDDAYAADLVSAPVNFETRHL